MGKAHCVDFKTTLILKIYVEFERVDIYLMQGNMDERILKPPNPLATLVYPTNAYCLLAHFHARVKNATKAYARHANTNFNCNTSSACSSKTCRHTHDAAEEDDICDEYDTLATCKWDPASASKL